MHIIDNVKWNRCGFDLLQYYRFLLVLNFDSPVVRAIEHGWDGMNDTIFQIINYFIRNLEKR